ncbi:NAD(P)H-binding protein [Bifidobacterium tsurumiense]|uniref:Oxidoreductase n=1 Tax=Bifidobacterium tsurumiense TaxID=356829 RepID=A0A087EES6_9BIFI|nr:NAD(P)H-binding protein [Bifidobacterium tsurumiense]KFJ06277.1 oxidoreductase [Bifidobacterium tsurumiense]MDY4678045.1 NAD(P)H-binding protein [Bifidobacterium tsurumiense]MSS12096.1 NAD(P)H-binding protein [Bifidobacterium tsurumiense]
MTNLLILGANGQIARLVAQRLLKENEDINLTLYLRNSSRVSDLAKDPRVRVVDGDIHDEATLEKAMQGQDIVFVSPVDHDVTNRQTRVVISAMNKAGLSRVVSANIGGIYDEVDGEFGRWNKETVTQAAIDNCLGSAQLYEQSGLDYTILRIPWLNDCDEVDYVITYKGEKYIGVSGSRKSIADVVIRIVDDPSFLVKDSVGIANAATEGSDRPVY